MIYKLWHVSDISSPSISFAPSALRPFGPSPRHEWQHAARLAVKVTSSGCSDICSSSAARSQQRPGHGINGITHIWCDMILLYYIFIYIYIYPYISIYIYTYIYIHIYTHIYIYIYPYILYIYIYYISIYGKPMWAWFFFNFHWAGWRKGKANESNGLECEIFTNSFVLDMSLESLEDPHKFPRAPYLFQRCWWQSSVGSSWLPCHPRQNIWENPDLIASRQKPVHS